MARKGNLYLQILLPYSTFVKTQVLDLFCTKVSSALLEPLQAIFRN